MNKKYVYCVIAAVITVVVLAIILVSDRPNDSAEFNKYKNYADNVGVTDWTISEDTAKSFADANCDKLAIGDMPSIKFMNVNHVKSSAAVIAAYCPDSFDNFLAGVVMKYPEYKGTALYINERLEIDSH